MKKIQKKRTSVICVKNDALLTFVGIDPATQQRIIFHPGGKPNEGESLPECAQRETFEETGYRVKVESSITVIKKYDFIWNKILYDCETHFYFAHLLNESNSKIYDVDYNHGIFWCPLSKLSQHLGYCTSILEATKEILSLAYKAQLRTMCS